MFVLPQILLVGDKILEKTAFVMNMPIRTKTASGLMRVDGVVRGRINGTVTGTMHAIVRGNVSAYVEAGDMTELSDEEYQTQLSTELNAENIKEDLKKETSTIEASSEKQKIEEVEQHD